MTFKLLPAIFSIGFLILAGLTIKDNVYEQPLLVSVGLGLFSLTFFFLAIHYSKAQSFFRIAGFILLLTTATSAYSNWLPQVEGGFPPQEFKIDVYSMSTQQLADQGETVIFGGIGQSKVQGAIGKGQCPLCHLFWPEQGTARAPNLWGITARKRLAPTSIDYIAESHVCPSCYVVGGFGLKGTENRESPMPAIHKSPISLTLDELIAVDTWLFVREGEIPPTPDEIVEAYRTLAPDSILPSRRQISEKDKESTNLKKRQNPFMAGGKMATGDEWLDELFNKSRCTGCHIIPGVRGAVGGLGPPLFMKTNAPLRLIDPAYTGSARTARQYLEESILNHNRFVVPGYNPSIVLAYDRMITPTAMNHMINYLIHLEEGMDLMPLFMKFPNL